MSTPETVPDPAEPEQAEDAVVVPTVEEAVGDTRLPLLAGEGGAQHRDAYEADIATISARIAVLKAYLLPAARKRFRSDNAEMVTLADLTGTAERLLRGLQGSLHGQAAFNAKGSVTDLHAAVVAQMAEVEVAEKALTARLDRVLTPRQAADLVDKLTGARDRAPTRPHPYTPHPPGLARFLFRASAASDRLMDTMDSRVLPRAKPRDIPAQPEQQQPKGDTP